MVFGELLVPVAAESEEAGEFVARKILWAEHLGELAFAVAAPHFELPHAILSHHVALGEEQVRGVLGVDVGDAPGVAQNLNRLAETGDRDGAPVLSEDGATA